MKRLSNILLIISLILLFYWSLTKIVSTVFYTRTTPTSLILAIFLLLIAVFIKLKSKEKIFVTFTSRKNVLLGLVFIILAELFLFYSKKPYVKEFIDQQAIDIMNRLYIRFWPIGTVSWLGINSMQYPTDNWVMQEIISEIKPDFIVETGTANGGTALFYATVLEKINPNGKVITVDIEPQIEESSRYKTFQERVEFIKGDSVSTEVIDAIDKRVKNGKVLVTLDSLHEKEHVLKELKLYSNFVSLNSYIVVQDGYLYKYKPGYLPPGDKGPAGAIEEFLKHNKNFQIDHSREKYCITQYPSGFLKRIK